MLQKMLCVAAAVLMLSGCAEKEPNTPDVLVPAVMVEGQVYCTTGEEFPGELARAFWAEKQKLHMNFVLALERDLGLTDN